MRFIAVAASWMTGRSCWRYTVSVTFVVRCPTRRAMFSSGTPSSDSGETKLRRSSRGRPVLGVQPGRCDHGAEAAQDAVPVAWCPGAGGEDEAIAFGAVLALR
jgi:hypothetical protein